MVSAVNAYVRSTSLVSSIGPPHAGTAKSNTAATRLRHMAGILALKEERKSKACAPRNPIHARKQADRCLTVAAVDVSVGVRSLTVAARLDAPRRIHTPAARTGSVRSTAAAG